VILISLSLSWITAVSTTPLLTALLLKPGSGDQEDDPYGGVLFLGYRRLLRQR
jgi:multidrug efflux pump subunit AcrB